MGERWEVGAMFPADQARIVAVGIADGEWVEQRTIVILPGHLRDQAQMLCDEHNRALRQAAL